MIRSNRLALAALAVSLTIGLAAAASACSMANSPGNRTPETTAAEQSAMAAAQANRQTTAQNSAQGTASPGGNQPGAGPDAIRSTGLVQPAAPSSGPATAQSGSQPAIPAPAAASGNPSDQPAPAAASGNQSDQPATATNGPASVPTAATATATTPSAGPTPAATATTTAAPPLKPTATPSPKPSATPSPKPTATPTASPTPTPTPKPSTTPTTTAYDPVAAQWRADIVRLTNAERAKEGLPAFRAATSALQNAAGVRALEIVTKFSHTRPNGSAFSSVLGEYGIAYSRTGENILHATAGAYTPAQIVQTWMGSPGHRANILNPDYNMLGVGFTRANGMDHFVQLFIRQ